MTQEVLPWAHLVQAPTLTPAMAISALLENLSSNLHWANTGGFESLFWGRRAKVAQSN